VHIIKVHSKKSYKYQIVSDLLPRHLEIFRFYKTKPIGGVSRFHFPAVRGVYDGNRVYVMPSLVSYANTGIFLDYKWMSSNKTTTNLILKYYIRGGLLILNENEHIELKKYILENMETWGIIIAKAETKYRSVSIMNPIFQPRHYGHGFYQKIGSNPICTYTHVSEDDPDFMEKYVTPSPSRFEFSLQIRYPSGNLRPLELWKIMPYL
jgi:hypothetical protein